MSADRSSASHIADMRFEAVGCLVGTEAAGGTPLSCLGHIAAAAHTHTPTHRLTDYGSASHCDEPRAHVLPS